MAGFAKTRGAQNVTVFVASDNAAVRPWFGDNAPDGWRIIASGKKFPKPESGVWFGELGSKTNAVLNRTQKYEAMAEAVADVFALGELRCFIHSELQQFQCGRHYLGKVFASSRLLPATWEKNQIS